MGTNKVSKDKVSRFYYTQTIFSLTLKFQKTGVNYVCIWCLIMLCYWLIYIVLWFIYCLLKPTNFPDGSDGSEKKMKVKVTQWCPTLCHPMDYIVHGILQARILEWVAFPFSRGSSQPRNQIQVSPIACRFFTSWATSKAPNGRESAYNATDLGLFPGSGRCPVEGNGKPLHYSFLGNSMGKRSLLGYSSWGHRVEHDWVTNTHIVSFNTKLRLQ